MFVSPPTLRTWTTADIIIDSSMCTMHCSGKVVNSLSRVPQRQTGSTAMANSEFMVQCRSTYLSTIAYLLALLLLLQATGLSLLLLVASETKNRRTAAVGKLIGNGDWPFHVCVRSGGREGADQRRKNIKGKRGKSPNGSEQREERRGGREGRPGQFTSVIYFLPGNLQPGTY